MTTDGFLAEEDIKRKIIMNFQQVFPNLSRCLLDPGHQAYLRQNPICLGQLLGAAYFSGCFGSVEGACKGAVRAYQDMRQQAGEENRLAYIKSTLADFSIEVVSSALVQAGIYAMQAAESVAIDIVAARREELHLLSCDAA